MAHQTAISLTETSRDNYSLLAEFTVEKLFTDNHSLQLMWRWSSLDLAILLFQQVKIFYFRDVEVNQRVILDPKLQKYRLSDLQPDKQYLICFRLTRRRYESVKIPNKTEVNNDQSAGLTNNGLKYYMPPLQTQNLLKRIYRTQGSEDYVSEMKCRVAQTNLLHWSAFMSSIMGIIAAVIISLWIFIILRRNRNFKKSAKICEQNVSLQPHSRSHSTRHKEHMFQYKHVFKPLCTPHCQHYLRCDRQRTQKSIVPDNSEKLRMLRNSQHMTHKSTNDETMQRDINGMDFSIIKSPSLTNKSMRPIGDKDNSVRSVYEHHTREHIECSAFGDGYNKLEKCEKGNKRNVSFMFADHSEFVMTESILDSSKQQQTNPQNTASFNRCNVREGILIFEENGTSSKEQETELHLEDSFVSGVQGGLTADELTGSAQSASCSALAGDYSDQISDTVHMDTFNHYNPVSNRRYHDLKTLPFVNQSRSPDATENIREETIVFEDPLSYTPTGFQCIHKSHEETDLPSHRNKDSIESHSKPNSERHEEGWEEEEKIYLSKSLERTYLFAQFVETL